MDYSNKTNWADIVKMFCSFRKKVNELKLGNKKINTKESKELLGDIVNDNKDLIKQKGLEILKSALENKGFISKKKNNWQFISVVVKLYI